MSLHCKFIVSRAGVFAQEQHRCRKPLEVFKGDLPPSDLEQVMYSEMQDLTLVGLVGIRDPPRSDVPVAINIIRKAGVRVFMVTGDFKLTALAIARQVGRRNVSYACGVLTDAMLV